MTDQLQETDPIEQELRRLQPRGLSDQFVESLGPRLQRSRESSSPIKRNVPNVLLPFIAVAVLVLMAISLTVETSTGKIAGSFHQDLGEPDGESQGDQIQEPVRPTLLAYNHALRSSQGNLDELLDYHARTLLPAVTLPGSPADQ